MDKQTRNQKSENFVGGGVENKGNFKEKDWYREKIIEMVKQIEDSLILKLIYGFTKSGCDEEKAGRK